MSEELASGMVPVLGQQKVWERPAFLSERSCRPCGKSPDHRCEDSAVILKFLPQSCRTRGAECWDPIYITLADMPGAEHHMRRGNLKMKSTPRGADLRNSETHDVLLKGLVPPDNMSKVCEMSLTIFTSKEHSGCASSKTDLFVLLAVHDMFDILRQHHVADLIPAFPSDRLFCLRNLHTLWKYVAALEKRMCPETEGSLWPKVK
ncbi:uncharacterized protein LOC111751558 [Loxodonta africana]|uniref:uncharacterized protein LOC111751558 n=1 Tax=Loxodonta africana TaxID=9785 RepID=UPI0030CC236B